MPSSRAAGLVPLALAGVEGPAAWFGDLDARMADPLDREVMLETARALEAVPEVLGIGPHLLLTARRP